MKLVNEMYVHHVQTMLLRDYSNPFIFMCITTGLEVWLSRLMRRRDSNLT
jgi:hypothetical protein